MTCPGCQKEVAADRRFCTWCERYIPDSRVGTKAGFGRRFAATFLDVVVFWVVFLVIVMVGSVLTMSAGGTSRSDASGAGAFILLLFLAWIGYTVILLWFLSQGLTPGKMLMHEQVIEHLGGGTPGLGRMLLREIFGKFVSGLFMGLGYFWAIWDKDGQAWHDKIAGTLVVNRAGGAAKAFNRAAATVTAARSPVISVTQFCTQCGGRVAGDQRFCSTCGAARA